MAERKPFLRVTEVNEELARLLEETRHREITPEDRFEQLVSFVYGNAMDDSITKEGVRERIRKVYPMPEETERSQS